MVFWKKLRDYIKNKALSEMASELKTAINGIDVPIIIISYNNYVYVENMTLQLNRLGVVPIIIDNNSTDSDSRKALHNLNDSKKARVIFGKFNFGYRVGFMSPLYETLPNFFGYTDPDLAFEDNIPESFVEDFINLTEKYEIYKVGCALSLSKEIGKDLYMTTPKQRKPFYVAPKKFTVAEWESRFWNMQINDDQFELYAAPIDTTFAIYNKKYYFNNLLDAIRVAGRYSVTHLPWHPDIDIMNKEQSLAYYKNNNSNSWRTKN
ncbi:glycosyltransferase [Pectobacterium quasiaquaticum]|uniref:Glycosyltransferase n=1 Tax=Pectobacterium quasiaquaticum TaxID=2774015 RepID=A0A9Q2ER75_9GAMM|nr:MULTISPECIES: glycosyltransferase [Pectobacterium]URG48873.1 glycosyltransferase [Pectobacterium quasiaquaticum]WJM82925.1 glycosyltransferase [Pectobacterium brasiliense]